METHRVIRSTKEVDAAVDTYRSECFIQQKQQAARIAHDKNACDLFPHSMGGELHFNVNEL